VRTIFAHSYDRRAIRNTGNAFRDPEKALRRVRRVAQRASSVVRVVVGHTPYGLHKAYMPSDSLYLTVLREPVDHTLSHYHYLVAPGRKGPQYLPTREGPRLLPLPTPETSLEEMLEGGVYLLDNMATRMLCNLESPFGALGPESLEQAKQNISRFAVVGITERLDESIVLIERTLGLGLVPYASQKVNSDRPSVAEASDDQRSVIEAHNRLDLELYSFACELFDRKVAAAGNGFEADVEELSRRSVGRDEPRAQLLSRERIKEQRRPKATPKRPQLVVYVHVPKTGGSTLETVLLRGCPRGSVRIAGNVFRNEDGTLERVRRLADPKKRVQVVTGVTPYGLLRAHLPENSRYVTVLRDPVDRTLSHYYWLIGSRAEGSQKYATREGPRLLPPPTAETSLEQMLEEGVYLLDNMATRMLCGRESPFGELSADALESAKQNLREGFELVGITERLEESIVLLQRMLGLGLVPYTSEKVNRDRPRLEEVPEEERALVEEHNRLDLELYALARELFERKAVASGKSLEAEAEELRRMSEAG